MRLGSWEIIYIYKTESFVIASISNYTYNIVRIAEPSQILYSEIRIYDYIYVIRSLVLRSKVIREYISFNRKSKYNTLNELAL